LIQSHFSWPVSSQKAETVRAEQFTERSGSSGQASSSRGFGTRTVAVGGRPACSHASTSVPEKRLADVFFMLGKLHGTEWVTADLLGRGRPVVAKVEREPHHRHAQVLLDL